MVASAADVRQAHAFTRRPRPGADAAGLLLLARRGIGEASLAEDAGARYAAAHLAALRAAAAVVAAKARPVPAASRRRPVSVWALLEQVAPELREWGSFFAAGARKRAAAEAGLSGHVTPREADDLLRDAETFLAVVETTLGLDIQGTLALRSARV